MPVTYSDTDVILWNLETFASHPCPRLWLTQHTEAKHITSLADIPAKPSLPCQSPLSTTFTTQKTPQKRRKIATKTSQFRLFRKPNCHSRTKNAQKPQWNVSLQQQECASPTHHPALSTSLSASLYRIIRVSLPHYEHITPASSTHVSCIAQPPLTPCTSPTNAIQRHTIRP